MAYEPRIRVHVRTPDHVHVGGVFCANLARYSIAKYWDYKSFNWKTLVTALKLRVSEQVAHKV